MATETDQAITETVVDTSIETLQAILADEQIELVSYEEARALGHELMTFFEVFGETGKQEGESDDSA